VRTGACRQVHAAAVRRCCFFPSCTQQSSAPRHPFGDVCSVCDVCCTLLCSRGRAESLLLSPSPSPVHQHPHGLTSLAVGMKYRSGTALEHILAVQLSSSQQVCFVQFARQFRRGTLVHGALGVVSVHCLRYCTSQHPSVTALLHAGRRVWGRVAG
jgi:hypothetical protein